jgi:SNF family Na+-dependent transporter
MLTFKVYIFYLRFPTICYLNGGGAFLIPFLVCLFVIGMPCMYLELAIGQYFQSGNITLWGRLNPYMKGIGYAVVLINILMLSYYNTLQAYALYYLGHSFQSPVPWSLCSKPWSTKNCHEISNQNTSYANVSFYNNNNEQIYLPSTEFFSRKLLGSHLSTGFHDMVAIKPDMLMCVAIIFVLTTSCLLGGIKSSGKAVYVTALLPYVCLIVLIAQSLTLDGSMDGLKYYLTPKFHSLFELRVWLAAAVQIFFSLGPGFGVLIAYSSYSKKNTNIQKLTLICSSINCITSLLYGVVVFAGLGYMAKRLNVPIDHFIQDGIGLVFIVYPEIIATFKHAYIFAVVFFLMLITLGLDSAFGSILLYIFFKFNC